VIEGYVQTKSLIASTKEREHFALADQLLIPMR